MSSSSSESHALRFRREPPRGAGGIQRRIGVMGLLLALSAGLFLGRSPPPTTAATAVALLPVVEVVGAVPRPGFYEAGTLHDALRAAGHADPASQVDAALHAGTRIVVPDTAEGVRLERMDDLLVVGLPIPVNTASARSLEAIPGIGPSLSAAIIADREARGPFHTIEDLDRVKGIGPATVEKLRPFVSTAPPSP